MSLRINHNLAALNAHRNLVNTNSALNSSMQRLSSGFRINRGADDPAGLVISEQFRAQIAGLNRAIDNSEGSISMVQTAEGALTEINNLLISMRELAIHAANEGFNDADQLAADQAEIANAIKTIDRIAANTQFGTKKLLDGSKENVATITTPNSSQVSIRSSSLQTGTYSLSAVKTADPTATLNTISLGISLANTDGNPYNLDEKIHNIDVVQSSDVAKKTSGSIAVEDAWSNGLTVAAAATVASVGSAASFTTAVAANAGQYTFIVNYQENGGTPVGNQTLTVDLATGDDSADLKTALDAQIAANTYLAGKVTTRVSITAGAAEIFFEAVNSGAQYSLRAEASSTNATTEWLSFAQGSSRGSSLGELVFTSTSANGTQTSESVVVANATYTTMADLVTAINTAIDANANLSQDDFAAAAFESTQIQFATKDEGSAYSLQHLDAANGTGDLRYVLGLSVDSQTNTGVDAIVNFNGYANSITNVEEGATGTFTLKSAADGEANQGTLEIVVATAANGITTGNMLLDAKATKYSVQLNGGPATIVTAGKNATIFTSSSREESITINYGLTSTGGNETISNTDQSLVFQIGANVGQTARISMRNMAGSSLGRYNTGNMFANLSEIDVTTVQGAQDAQSIIDAAINEVSTTRGTLGSFQKNTLESNLRNLRIAAQNLTASESQIRDTDMAKEMSEFTKNQILVQAGTAMLAQANQIPQVILSLF